MLGLSVNFHVHILTSGSNSGGFFSVFVLEDFSLGMHYSADLLSVYPDLCYAEKSPKYCTACNCKAVNRGDKRTRRVRDRDFVKLERSRRYRDRYRCQEKKSRRCRDSYLVFRERELDR